MHADSIATREAVGTELIRLAVRVTGVVQGVGFRPFVYSLATRLSLAGFVRNAGGTVEIEIEGRKPMVQEFLQALRSESPPLAAIHAIDVVEIPCVGNPILEFTIYTSAVISDTAKAVPADSATCADCLQELLDPKDRRYRYPFINCTNCGPRFTIIKSLPYDRPTTTMAAFNMCALCRGEYDDPVNRRFHAQPNACPGCGPSLSFLPSTGNGSSHVVTESDRSEVALRLAINVLQQGSILAVKGLGGFHLMCDARNEKAVLTLRQRKQRYGKPLAVMMSAPAMVREFCHLSLAEETFLLSSRRPIVLLQKLDGSRNEGGLVASLRSNDYEPGILLDCSIGIAPSVAPGIDHFGVMLPYTPLHHLLLADFRAPLVATSGNQSDEPIAIENDEALDRLSEIADAFLVHDREIESRYDDSVARVFQGAETLIRRSRGFAPLPIEIPVRAAVPVLACGGQLKNTFCLITNDKAFVSQHIGDLDNLESLRHFEESLDRFKHLFSIEPEIVAHDLHPDYLSTSLAREIAAQGKETVAVQHHHAHIASCMAEHGLTDPVIGVAFDGLGYGLDGSAWGGEFLVCDWKSIERRGYFQPVAMPGGPEAIRKPWRMALGYLFSDQEACGEVFQDFVNAMCERYSTKVVSVIRRQVEKQVNAPMTSSCGRLFDAMSALLGVCLDASYEGQAAMELEARVDCGLVAGVAANSISAFDQIEHYRHDVEYTGGALVVRPHSILRSALVDLKSGQSRGRVAARFHGTIARIVVDVCLRIRRDTGLNKVCLSGGVFQNTVLLGLSTQQLKLAGFEVFYPRQLPANDGGLSLGQAVIALSKVDALDLRTQARS